MKRWSGRNAYRSAAIAKIRQNMGYDSAALGALHVPSLGV